MSVPPAFKEVGPWQLASPADQVPRGAWWQAFGDPTLNVLEQSVDRANPTLAAALAAYDQARAFSNEAKASLLPTLTASGDTSYNRQSNDRPLRGAGQPDDYTSNTLGGDVNYELDFWGRIRNQVAAGEAQAQAAHADLASARLSLQAQVADSYLQLRGLDAQTILLNSTVVAYQRALTLVQARHTGGVSSGLDVQRATAQLFSAKAQVSEIAAERALFEHAIAAVTGEDPSSFSIKPAGADRRIPQVPVGVPSVLIQRRPDIAAAERRAYAANRLIGVARAAYFPSLTLAGQGGYQNAGGNSLLTSPNAFWTIGPQMALTIFDGGRRKAGVQASKAAFMLASAKYRSAVLSAFQDVEDQLALANHLAVEAGDENRAVKATEATTHLSLVRYREGATNYLDVVTAQTAELQAEQTALALETRRQQACVNLVRALGGGWSAGALTEVAHQRPTSA